MEITYILLGEIFVILWLFKIFSSWLVISIVILSLASCYIFFRKKNILIYIIPILFLLRLVLGVYHSDFNYLETLKLKIELNRGIGNVLKVDNKNLSEKIIIYIPELKDGKYNIWGEFKGIEKKEDKSIISINIIDTKEIEENFLERYFKKKVDSFVKKGNRYFKRVYRAVILGDSKSIPKDLKEKFNYVGVSHLFALSGLHIGIVMSTIGFIVGKFSFSRKMRYIIILVGITLYFLGIKHSPSLIRAYIMGVIFIFGKLLYEDLDLEKSLAISFIISVFINPISIYEISFKLSYLALVAIVSIYPYIIKFYKGKSKFIKNIILVATIQTFLTPILIKEFGIIQIFSILSNLVVVPIGTVYITLSFVALLLENFGIGGILFPIVNIVFNLLIKTVEIFTKIPMLSVKYNGNKGEIISIIFYVIIFGIIFFNKFRIERKKDEKIFRRTKISQ